MSFRDTLGWRVQALRAEGQHEVGATIVRNGQPVTLIDGYPRSPSEIFDELAAPIDASTWCFTKDGELLAKLRIAFHSGNPTYQLARPNEGLEYGVVSEPLVEFVGHVFKRVAATAVEPVKNTNWNFGRISQ